MLAGLIRDDERRTLEGVPGLSDVPILGRLFAKHRREAQETDIILMMTPQIIRVLDLTEADLRPFRVGRDAGSTIIELPAPVERPVPHSPPQQVPVPPVGTEVPGAPQPTAHILRPPPPPPSTTTTTIPPNR